MPAKRIGAQPGNALGGAGLAGKGDQDFAAGLGRAAKRDPKTMARPLARGPTSRKPRIFKRFFGAQPGALSAFEPLMRPGTGFTRCNQRTQSGEAPMHLDIITIQPLVALLFGILILILPRLLNYLIAIYLIFIGLVGLFPHIFTTTI